MNSSTSQLQETVSRLFSEGKIDLFIGYEKGSLPLTTTPCFLRSKDQVGRLTWDSFCSNNLSVYLPRYFLPDPRNKEKKFPRIGIMVKGCDGRNLIGLSNEKQIIRSHITIVGVVCAGVIDKDKLLKKLGGEEPVEVSDDSSKLTILGRDGKKVEFDRASFLADPCLVCEDNIPPVSDILIGERAALEKNEDNLVKEFGARALKERWEYFEQEMAKCVRCYACRQACPLCYCKECFADQTYPKWIGASSSLSDVMFFHLGRMFHTVGRCVDCGACARACPMGVDLRSFQKKLVEAGKDRCGHKPGFYLEEVAHLATFSLEDRQEFITEPR